MTTGGASGGTGGAAINAAAQTIARMKTDMASIAASAKGIAQSMGQVSGSSVGAHGLSAFTSGSGVGYTNNQGMSLGAITAQSYATTGMSGQTARLGAAVIGMGAAKAALNVGAGAINDFRVGASDALDYEHARYVAFMGTGDYSRFNQNMAAAMNNFNVLDRSKMQSDVAQALNQGWASSYGGGTVGERLAAQNVGAFYTAARISGLGADAVGAAANSIYSPKGTYASMAMGVMTYDPATGNQLPLEKIAAQFYRNAGFSRVKSEDELSRNMRPGGQFDVMLQNQYGPEGAEMIKGLIRTQWRSGGNPVPVGGLEAAGLAAGELGKTPGQDSITKLNKSQEQVISKYSDATLSGVSSANDILASINGHMFEATGTLEKILEAINTAGGFGDMMKSGAPNLTSAITGGIGGLVSGILGITAGKYASKALLSLLTKGGQTAAEAGAGAAEAAGTTAKGAASAAEAAGAAAKTGGLLSKLGGLFKGGVGKVLGKAALPLAIASTALDVWDIGKAGWNARDQGFSGMRSAMGNAAYDVLNTGFAKWGPIAPVTAVMRQLFDLFNLHDRSHEEPDAFAEGAWAIEKDQTANVHQGEMIIPNRIAEAVRTELRGGTIKGGPVHGVNGRGGTTVNIHLTVQRATDNEAMLFAQRVKKYMDQDNELSSIGTGALGS